jgi:metal-responsive CopG/Arc/MetJ family transcriptional regulator
MTRVVQMTLDAELVVAVDRAVRRLRTTRSAFTREALRAALASLRTRQKEEEHREGYRRKPKRRGEFASWHAEQSWPD